jgi:serine/threonine protein kinase
MSGPIKKLSRYELHEKIGEGGFGSVYRASDPKWGKLVAIKVLHANLAENSRIIDRFVREARTTFSLHHPHIIAVMDLGDEDGRYFLVMDYVEGGTLLKLMRERGVLPLPEVIRLLEPVAEALDYAHSQNVIHRDVKPSNILIDGKGQVFLSDFGLVKLLDEEDSSTTATALLGTYEYMAPEQVTGKTLSAATDLYALGVIAYQMVTGQVPFGGTPFEVQEGHVRHEPPDPKKLVMMPDAEAGVILKMLAKDPAGRYASGREFIGALKNASQQFNQDEALKLDEAARQKAEVYDFKGAITLLEQAQAIAPTVGRKALLDETHQKEILYQEYLRKQAEFETARQSLLTLRQKAPWIHQPPLEKEASSLPVLEIVEDIILFLLVAAFMVLTSSSRAFPFSFAFILMILSALLVNKHKTVTFLSLLAAVAGLILYFNGRAAIVSGEAFPYYLAPNLLYGADVVFGISVFVTLERFIRVFGVGRNQK